MFDLPTDTKSERREATRFRNSLLDLGYLMLQYSVYARCAITFEKRDAHIKQLKTVAPDTGNIQCIFITDAQWGKTVFISKAEEKAKRQIDKTDNIGEQLQFW